MTRMSLISHPIMKHNYRASSVCLFVYEYEAIFPSNECLQSDCCGIFPINQSSPVARSRGLERAHVNRLPVRLASRNDSKLADQRQKKKRKYHTAIQSLTNDNNNNLPEGPHSAELPLVGIDGRKLEIIEPP